MMRRQAKPFTVQVKKSKKNASAPEPLFSPELLALAPERPAYRSEISADKFFAPPRPSAEAQLAFREAERPATRILPDLTAAAPTPAPIEPLDERPAPTPKPRLKKAPRKPKVTVQAYDSEPIEIVMPIAFAGAAKRVMPSREQRRAKRRTEAGVALLRGERWKRRLPPVLR